MKAPASQAGSGGITSAAAGGAVAPEAPGGEPAPAASAGGIPTIAASGEQWLSFGCAGGVFAQREFKNGEVVENAPVLVIPGEELADMERGGLGCYSCAWGDGYALALGMVPVYDRAGEPNAVPVKNLEALTIAVTALRDIAAGEAIVLDVDGNFWRAERKPAPERGMHGRDARRERERACREAEAQALAQEACRSALVRLPPLQGRTLMLGDGVELELAPVPYGVFVVGGEEEDPEVYVLDKPQHKRFLDDYLIGRYPVTVRQFAAFAEATGYRTVAEQEGTGWVRNRVRWEEIRGADWRHPQGPESGVGSKADHPVTLVSWDDAMAFCDWACRVTGQRVGLPDELEWEKAARGTDGRPWPWGSEPPDPARCNYLNNVGDTTPVGQYSPRGDSPYHCAGMAGNVMEWTASRVRMYPYEDDERRGGPDERILRGGAFHQGRRCMRCSARSWDYRREVFNCYGFRVRVSLEEGDGASR